MALLSGRACALKAREDRKFEEVFLWVFLLVLFCFVCLFLFCFVFSRDAAKLKLSDGLTMRNDYHYFVNNRSFDFCVCYFTVFTLSIQTPQLLTILNLKFEQVQFTTHSCV